LKGRAKPNHRFSKPEEQGPDKMGTGLRKTINGTGQKSKWEKALQDPFESAADCKTTYEKKKGGGVIWERKRMNHQGGGEGNRVFRRPLEDANDKKKYTTTEGKRWRGKKKSRTRGGSKHCGGNAGKQGCKPPMIILVQSTRIQVWGGKDSLKPKG